MRHVTGHETSQVPFAVLSALVVALLAPSATAALEAEPYLFVARTTGHLEFATGIVCPVAASTEDGNEDAWGVGVALRLSGPWWLDLRWSDLDTDVTYLDPEGRAISGPTIPLAVSRLETGVVYRFSDRKVSPFATAFAGVVRFDGRVSTPMRGELDRDRMTAGLGGGLLVDWGSHLGLRVQVRGTVSDLPDDLGGELEQVEGSVDLRLRL